MKKSLIVTALAGAVAGFFLRRAQLAKSFDEAGLIPKGDGISTALYLVCAAAGLVALILCLCTKKGTIPMITKKMPLRGVLTSIAAFGILGAYVPPNFNGTLGEKLILILALLSTCAIAVEGVFHIQGHNGSLVGGCILPVYLAVLLIHDYRTWSYNPLVSQFAFPLLFLVFAMMSAFEVAAFRVGKGKRRLTAFLIACTVCMAGPAFADGGLQNTLLILAISLYLIVEFYPFWMADPIPEASAKDSDALS